MIRRSFFKLASMATASALLGPQLLRTQLARAQAPQPAMPSREEMIRKRVVLEVPGMHDVRVVSAVKYARGANGPLVMDVYLPPDVTARELRPAVVFATGYADPGFERFAGSKLKNMGSYISWAQLLASMGMIAVTYENENPHRDGIAVLEHLKRNAASLNIDAQRIGIWSFSGNVPNALSLLMSARDRIACAVFCYGYLLDLEGATDVSAAAAAIGFVNPNSGKSLDDVPANVPMFIARAGQDTSPNLNRNLDQFVCGSLKRNLPVTVANHARARHAFDILDDNEETKAIIRQMLSFMKSHLTAGSR